jgi:hypothetical protein
LSAALDPTQGDRPPHDDNADRRDGDLGISPLHRLVVPRVAAVMVVALLLSGLVSVVGVAGGYFFSVVVEHGTPGPYFASFTEPAQLPDLVQAEIKEVVFGFVSTSQSAQVVVACDATVTTAASTGRDQSVLTHYRMVMHLVKLHGRWLVSDVAFAGAPQ